MTVSFLVGACLCNISCPFLLWVPTEGFVFDPKNKIWFGRNRGRISSSNEIQQAKWEIWDLYWKSWRLRWIRGLADVRGCPAGGSVPNSESWSSCVSAEHLNSYATEGVVEPEGVVVADGVWWGWGLHWSLTTAFPSPANPQLTAFISLALPSAVISVFPACPPAVLLCWWIQETRERILYYL